MPRVLLIDPDRDALATLQKALGQAGFRDIAAASSGSFALTMLERDRPDLIVSRARVPDIDGSELCSIVRKDPSMAGVLFLLLAEPGDDAAGDAREGGPDRKLVGELTPVRIVSEVTDLLGADAPAAPRPPASPAGEPGATQGMRGSLGVMDLPDISQAIALGGKTGVLILALPSGQGVIVFDRGRVVHAEFFGLMGETAFAALVMAAHREAQGNFAFSPLEALAQDVPRTIQRSLKQLMLSAAAEIDEGRADTAAASAP
jgi:CheY-like chemotaxis protein